MIKAILFDLDDTLFDHRHSSREGLRSVWKRYTCFQEMTLDEFELEHRGMLEKIHLSQVLVGKLSLEEARAERFRHLFLNRNVEVDFDTSRNAAEIFRNSFEKNFRRIKGAEELLKALKKNYKIGIITNNFINEQENKLKQIGLISYIDHMITSEEIGVAKPHPLLFSTACERLGASPDTAVMIGDSWDNDIAGANAVGMKCIWLNHNKVTCPDPAKAIEIRSIENAEYIKMLITSFK
jgi:HAD superfamily hydrolase (TIGR01549 family)